MKIGLVLDTTLDSDAGVQQYFKGLARFLLQNGHDIRFIVPASKDEGEFQGKIYSVGKTFNPLGNQTSVPISFFTNSSKIKDILEKENFDIIHISAPFSPFMGAKVVKLADCPIVLTYHTSTRNLIYKIGTKLLGLLMKNMYKRVDAFIAPSDEALREASVMYRADYKIISNAVDLSTFHKKAAPLEKFSSYKNKIVFLGRLEVRKGVEHLIKAFKIIKKQIKDATLIICGDGPLKNSLQLSASPSAGSGHGSLRLENVIFEGYVDEKLKQRYYASADVCVFPALYGETFGIVLIESMASGKVTLGYKNKGYEFVLRNLPELLVETGNTQALAERIIKFLKDEKLRHEFEAKCLKEAEKYSWKMIGNQILEIYEGLINNNQ